MHSYIIITESTYESEQVPGRGELAAGLVRVPNPDVELVQAHARGRRLRAVHERPRDLDRRVRLRRRLRHGQTQLRQVAVARRPGRRREVRRARPEVVAARAAHRAALPGRGAGRLMARARGRGLRGRLRLGHWRVRADQIRLVLVVGGERAARRLRALAAAPAERRARLLVEDARRLRHLRAPSCGHLRLPRADAVLFGHETRAIGRAARVERQRRVLVAPDRAARRARGHRTLAAGRRARRLLLRPAENS